ncbi:MAG TPA: hotdog domain-containing protein [Candidatus Dormibacteraeota bacterium]|jgi:acyl-coenzyme A thioesterase PaaI-like protein|nr:hotdog domain-containing protein [Candidatus Dormibacteraeota bacterium]
MADLALTAMEAALAEVAGDHGLDCFDLKLNYMIAVRDEETLTSAVRVLHIGRRSAVAFCELKDGEIAVATATATFLKTPSGSPDAD